MPQQGRVQEVLLPITRGSPWRTSCWWPFGSGAEEASGVASGCWGLPGKSWGCVMAGNSRGAQGGATAWGHGRRNERGQWGWLPPSGTRCKGWR